MEKIQKRDFKRKKKKEKKERTCNLVFIQELLDIFKVKENC